jgi:dTDP-4-dehydrorhamnose 3,5-epimerase
MNVTPAAGLPDILVIEPTVHRDPRGFFVEIFQAARYRAHGMTAEFVQDNQSRSRRGTLRGLHWQTGEHAQAKLVRVIAGEIFDVAVDVRPDSPTFGRWSGTRLSGDNFRQMYIPTGFAHGFCVLSEEADVEYKCSAPYHPAAERGLIWNDPEIGIAWPLDAPTLSPRDERHPTLAELRALYAREGVAG